jgi:hypothetical protein
MLTFTKNEDSSFYSHTWAIFKTEKAIEKRKKAD